MVRQTVGSDIFPVGFSFHLSLSTVLLSNCLLLMHLSLQNGCTPLMEASSGGHVKCVKLLLEKGARANDQNKVGKTEFMSEQCPLL